MGEAHTDTLLSYIIVASRNLQLKIYQARDCQRIRV